MCAPSASKPTRRVIIAGAGPAGLLNAALLLARNKESDATVNYDVTLVDGRQNFGKLSQEELTKSFRSWMLSLASHGMDAIREAPGLYDYVKDVGIEIKEFNLFLGSKRINQTITDDTKDGEPPEDGFIVDRNFVVAALARYVNDLSDPYFHARYLTTCQYVDYQNKQVLIRDMETKEEDYLPYDLLLGCDGIRSVVREALIKQHPSFACDITDIFQEFKATHIDLPPSVNCNAFTLLPDIFPGLQGIALPETGGKINLSCGTPRNVFDTIAEELKSSDYKVVSRYVKDNFKAFELVDYDDFAKQWVKQRWNRTGMVHCNFYHSVELSIVIMGDAAHATSPSIGMGMNTALRDAQSFYKILKEHDDDLSKALPIFSNERVKEGNSLSDMAMHLYSMDKTQQTIETFHMVIRGALNKFFPSLVAEHPQTMIGRRQLTLSEVYDHGVKLGIITKHRATNDEIRREYFESAVGMVKKPNKGGMINKKMILGAVQVAVSVSEPKIYSRDFLTNFSKINTRPSGLPDLGYITLAEKLESEAIRQPRGPRAGTKGFKLKRTVKMTFPKSS